MKRLFILPFVLIWVLLLLSCEGPEGIQGVPGENPIMVSGYIDKYPANHPINPNAIWCRIGILNSPSAPQVHLNDIMIPLHEYGEYVETALQYSQINLPFSQGDSVHLTIEYEQLDGDSATAYADIFIPGVFEINNVDTNFIVVEFGEDFELSWTQSSGSNAYSYLLQLMYEYVNTSGDTIFFQHIWENIYDQGTSILFDSETLYPGYDEFDILIGFNGYCLVRAIHGPCKEGDSGNIQGEGMGFFTSSILPSNCDYYYAYLRLLGY